MNVKPEAPVAATLAIDLAKDVFELGLADARGKLIHRQRLRHPVFASRLDNHAPLRIVMEACGSASESDCTGEAKVKRPERACPLDKVKNRVGV